MEAKRSSKLRGVSRAAVGVGIWSALLLVSMMLVCASARCQSFTNPVRVATPVDPSSLTYGDVNGDGRVDLIWVEVGATGTLGHVELAQSGGGYVAGQPFTIPGSTGSVPMCVTADVTRDSKLDVICAVLDVYTASTTVFVFAGNGDGTFAAPVATQFGSQYGQAIFLTSVGDLNGDSVPDFILEDYLYTPALVLLSDGHGGFLPTKTVQNSYNISVPVAADINGDGIPDLLWSEGAAVALGRGDGSFNSLLAPTVPVTVAPITCAFHDMDGDGKLDAVCGYSLPAASGTELEILHGNGDGTFNPSAISQTTFGSASISRSGSGDFIQPEVIRDVNGDGIPDVLAYAGDGLSVLLGQPGLTFAAPSRYALSFVAFELNSTEPGERQYTDLNGDGILDVLAAGPNGMYLLYGHADGSFGSALATKVSEVSGHVAVADFNSDGKPDLVSTGAPGTSLSLGRGDGTFASPVPVQGSPFAAGAGIYVADFNGDGKADLLSNDASSAYQLMLGNGDGTFASAIATSGLPALLSENIIGVFTTAYALTADLNGDGRADVFFFQTGPGDATYSLVSALSVGNGGFQTVSTGYAAPYDVLDAYYYTPVAPVLGDFAHSGKLDAAYFIGGNIDVVHGHGDGSFDATPTALATPIVSGVAANSYQALQVGDMDEDGNLDLVFLSWFAPSNGSQLGPSCVFVYYGRGDGTFEAPTQAGCFTHAYTDLRVADVNGDGRPDLILQANSVTYLYNYAVGVIDNLGGRSFGSEINFTAGSLSGDLFVTDLNLDGLPDLVFGNQRPESGYSANSVTVLLNTGAPVVTGVLSSTPNPSMLGQSYTITASLTPLTSTVLSGAVTFLVDGTTLGAVALSGNTASIAGPTTLAVGTHQLAATWPGANSYGPVSLAGTHTVTGYPSVSVLTVAPSPGTYGAPVLLTATVTPGNSVTSPTPTGTVTFLDGSTVLGTVTLSSAGVAVLLTSSLPVGTDELTCTYSGGSVWAASVCNIVPEVINGEGTVLTLSSSLNPAAVLASVTFTVHLAVSGGGVPPVGSVVSLSLNGQTIALATDASGNASYATSALGVGSYPVVATFAATANLLGSSAALTEVVTAIPTSVALTAAPNPAYQGQAVVLTATVSGTPVPTGSVTFLDNGTVLGAGTLSAAGVATLTVSTLAVGTHPLTAAYAAGTAFWGSVSGVVPEVVLASGFGIALAPTTVTVAAGQMTTDGIQLTSLGLFAGPLALTYGPLPQYMTATISPTPVTLVAGGTGASVLRLNTLQRAESRPVGRPFGRGRTAEVMSAMVLLGVWFVGRRRRVGRLVLVLAMMVAAQGMMGCTNAWYEDEEVAAGTYMVPVTATDANGNSHTAVLTVVVTP